MGKNQARFDFIAPSTLAVRKAGNVRCNFCYCDFTAPEVEVSIHDFTICPSCTQWGPKEAANKATRNAADESRLATWGEAPEDQRGIAKQYLATAKALRRFDTFAEIPGGYVAIAIAYAPPNDPRRLHGGLLPKDVRHGSRKAA
jgi:hypothetical protein